VLSSTSSAVLNTNTFNVAVDFGKSVDSFTAANITLSGGTASNIVPVDAAAGKYSFTVTATSDGSVAVLVAAGVVRDTAGNGNSASNSLIRIVDRVAPRPTLTANVPALTNQANFVLSINFGKEVTGFTVSDVVTTGAALNNLQPLGGGRFTLTATSTGGPATFNIPAAAANDLAGNASLAATALAVTVDLTAPLPSLTTTAPPLSKAASFTVAANFGEEVVGFALSDLLLINGVASALTAVNQATGSFNFIVTPTADGLTSVLVPAGAGSDKAGNLSQASSLLSRTFDRQAPVPVLTTSEPERTNQTTFEVIANFGEPVTGLTKSDFQVTGATISDPLDLGNGRYAVTLSGASGVVELQLAAGAVMDVAGNSSSVSNRLSRTIDISRILPLLTTSVPPLTSADSFVVAIDFTQPVIGFTANHLFVLGGSVSDLAVVDAATGKYSVKVTPASDGVVTLLLPANASTDLVGNGNLAAAPLVRTIDRVAPVVSLSSDQTSPTLETTFDVIVHSSKPISNLTSASFTVSGGSIGQPVPMSDGRYRVPVSAVGGLFELSVQVGAVSDSAGNTNAASNVLSIEVTPRSRVIIPQQPSGTIDLSTLGEQDLTGAETIDLRGQGDNLLTLDSAKIASFFTDSAAIIYADPGDTVAFAGQWTFDAVLLVDGQIHRVFSQAGATVKLQGPYDFSNPINRFDVDASGDVAALDALNILNAIRAKLLTDANGAFLPLTTETLASFRFLDVDQNNQLAPLDALLVLIEMSRSNRGLSSGEGEQVEFAPLMMIDQASENEERSEQDAIRIVNDSGGRLMWTEADEAVEAQSVNSVGAGHSSVRVNEAEMLVDAAFADPLLLADNTPALEPRL